MTSAGPEPSGTAGPLEASSPAHAGFGGYAVKLAIFEGPLDLLLHLIRANEVDVTDIPIARIAEQYVETLALMQELNLDVAGEYLVMAATLAWIKSRMILPPPPGEEDEEELDPRAELVARLLEYQRFKEASEALADRHRLDRDVFRAAGADPEPVAEAEREIAVGLVQLLEAFRRVVRGVPRGEGIHEVEVEPIPVRERMLAVMERLEAEPSLEFEQALGLDPGRPVTRPFLVATFLAILELVRLAAIRIYQGLDEEGVPVGPIRLRARVEPGGAPWAERIAEIM